MDKIVGIVSKSTQSRSKNDDDFADRLSSRYTVVLLAAFAVLVGRHQVSYCSQLHHRPASRGRRLSGSKQFLYVIAKFFWQHPVTKNEKIKHGIY